MIAALRRPWPTGRLILAGLIVIAATALTLRAMGHPWICPCGFVTLWHGDAFDAQSSQQITDWYTLSHIVHGLIFYFGLWLLARRWSVQSRAVAALLIEAGWEIFENSPIIIERYRAVTIALDYFGDSIINSVSDILAMAFGFFLAARLPTWAAIAFGLALELLAAYVIRDNLTLNIIMLVWPVDAILKWQGGG